MNDDLREPTEEEMRAAFEEQMRQVSAEEVILQSVATLVDLTARRLGLIPEPGKDPAKARDLAQAKLAIDGARALAPLCPDKHQESIRDALSQLQLAYARAVGATAGPDAGLAAEPAAPAADPPADPGATPPPADRGEAERAKARAKIWTPPGA
jgi:hypothetical protein